MKYILKKRPRRPIIIEGFPGYGLVGSIATNYLIDTLNMEEIGNFYSEKIPPLAPVHKGKLMSPLGLYYSKEFNIIVANVVVAQHDIEWDYANAMINLARELNARKIISIEGVQSVPNRHRVFVYTPDQKEAELLKKLNFEFFQEAMIVGPTAALMLLSNNIPVIGLFAETASGIPDSRAAAEAIKAVDKYLGLKIDYKPLIQEAQGFERTLKKLLESSIKAQEEKEKKRLDYFG